MVLNRIANAVDAAATAASTSVDDILPDFVGFDDENPISKSPTYFLEIFSPPVDLTENDKFKLIDLQKQKTYFDARGQDFNFFEENFSSKSQRSVFALTEDIVEVFGGERIADTIRAKSRHTVITDLDIKANIYTSRERDPRHMSVIRIYNPNKQKVQNITRQSVVRLFLGFERARVDQVYEGIVLNVEHEFEEGDTVLALHCMPFFAAIINRSTHQIPNKKITPINLNITKEQGFYGAFETLIEVLSDGVRDSRWGAEIKLEENWRTKITLKSAENESTTAFSIPLNLPMTITQIIDYYLNYASKAGNAGDKISWYIDDSGIIRFAHGEKPVGKIKSKRAVIGENAHKVRAVFNTGTFPASVNSIAFEGKKTMYFLVSLVGKSSLQLGDSMIIRGQTTDNEVLQRLNIIAKNNLGFEDLENREFKIDSIRHIFDTQSSFITTVGLIDLKGEYFLDDSPNRKKYLEAASGTPGKSKEQQELEMTIQMLRAEKYHLFNTFDGKLESGITYLKGELEKNEVNVDVLSGNGVYAKQEFLGTYAQGKDEIVPRDQTITTDAGTQMRVNVTSPWATVVSEGNLKVGAGIWFPHSTAPFNEQQMKFVVNRFDKFDYELGREWIEGIVPVAFATDYIMRSPARSVDIMPTEKNEGYKDGSGGTEYPDQGSRTQIFNQYLVEANPLTNTNVSGGGLLNSRPSIRRIVNETIGTANVRTNVDGSDGTSALGGIDDQIVHMVTDNSRAVTTKRIARHKGITRNADGEMDIASNRQPEILDILDDKAADGNRVVDYAHNADGSTPVREIEVGQSKIIVEGQSSTPKIQMILKKDDTTSPYFIMDNDGIRLHFDRSTSDGDTDNGFINLSTDGVYINASNITLGQSDTLDSLTLNGNLTVKGTTTLEADVTVKDGSGGANKFTIASATGNTVVEGDMDVTGTVTGGA